MAATSCSPSSLVLFLVHRFAYVLFWSTFYFRLRAVDVTTVHSHLSSLAFTTVKEYCTKYQVPSTKMHDSSQFSKLPLVTYPWCDKKGRELLHVLLIFLPQYQCLFLSSKY